jgi:hypothetical protein
MTQLSTLLLHIDDGRALPVQVHKETAVRSPHTGKELQELHGWIVTSDPQLHQRLARMLPAVGERPMRSEDSAGEFTGRWSVSWNSYSEAVGVHTYTLILREAEELSLRSLVLDGMEMHPYEYREEAVGDGLVIRAKLVGTEEDVLHLRQLVVERDAFSVARVGIQDEPRSMRLGVEEWSEFEDRVKYRIALVDVGLEAGLDEGLSGAESESSRAALAFYANYLERLAELMVRKGLLSREELRALRDTARAEPGVSRHELWRVADVDQA